MGFERRKIYRLEWPEGAELAGLEVRATPTSVRNYLVLTALVDGDAPDSYEDEDGAWEFKGNLDGQFEFIVKKFSKCLLSWNLEDEGIAVPATEASVWEQDREFVLVVIRAWLDSLASVSRPLETPSPAGTQSAVELIPMETLSESLAS